MSVNSLKWVIIGSGIDWFLFSSKPQHEPEIIIEVCSLTNADLLIELSGTNIKEIWIKIDIINFDSTKAFKMSRIYFVDVFMLNFVPMERGNGVAAMKQCVLNKRPQDTNAAFYLRIFSIILKLNI